MFKKQIQKKERVVEKSVHYTAEIAGYDVIFIEDENDGPQLSVYPVGADRLRLGIIKCRPRSVADLEQFAKEAPALFEAIAAELRALGKDDLRDRFERERGAMDARPRLISARRLP